jgi:hypothetical protein
MSILSFDISFNFAFRAALSGEPGAYDFTGSFTGGGTLLLPLKPEILDGAGDFSGAKAA